MTQRSKKMGQGAMGLETMGWIEVKPRWANHPVLLHNGSRQESIQGRVQAPPPEENLTEVREGRRGLRRV